MQTNPSMQPMPGGGRAGGPPGQTGRPAGGQIFGARKLWQVHRHVVERVWWMCSHVKFGSCSLREQKWKIPGKVLMTWSSKHRAQALCAQNCLFNSTHLCVLQKAGLSTYLLSTRDPKARDVVCYYRHTSKHTCLYIYTTHRYMISKN